MSGLTDQLGRFETRLQGFTAETTQNLTNIRETVDKNLHTFTGETKQDLENIRVTVDKNLRAMQEDNNKKLVPEGVESSEYLRLVLNALHFLCQGTRPQLGGSTRRLCHLRETQLVVHGAHLLLEKLLLL